ncbi:major facilitator superfamily [Micromonas commoda]|uniref:Major facilitator superfamily n=1 Tax=Micromonas commoda (strain RCC299 / NOUM17 / CCMP2709) TaxID=296587 RepID=C1FHH9_MICCC|nr:major facilitator superfamily [Micromonas commoda]ACO69824.1 major facilitator superfamily [Micromonas commoda]|eukprot:XP_002508566.1 major facilitator superfamily [Micromonas commoda]
MPFKVAGHRERNPRVQFGGQVKVSPEDVIEKVGWRSGGYQQFLLLVTCITIASEAAEVALLSLILPHVKNEFNLTNWETDKVAMSIFAGQMFGCFVMGALADSFGRKPCSIIASALVAVGGYASALADSTTALMICRFAVGLGVGAAFVPVDMLAEACPDHVRTTRTQLANLSFSAGVVAVTVVGAVILEPWGWRLLAFVAAVPPTVALVMAFYLDESPTWLADVGRGSEAKRALDRICVENTGYPLPEGLHIVGEREAGGGATMDVAEKGVASAGGGAGEASAWYNLAGNLVNLFRTVCLWSLAFVQTFNFYGLMLNAPVVFRVKQYADDGVTELTNRVVFDYAAILIVNSGDLVGNFSALLALRMKTNPRRVAAACAAISVPMLFVPLVPALNSHRWGLVFLMLVGRIPAAPIGSMSWILNAVAYPTLFRATGHGWANAVARFGAVTASSMYSMPAALSIPIHALALVAAIPAALFMPAGALEHDQSPKGRR